MWPFDHSDDIRGLQCFCWTVLVWRTVLGTVPVPRALNTGIQAHIWMFHTHFRFSIFETKVITSFQHCLPHRFPVCLLSWQMPSYLLHCTCWLPSSCPPPPLSSLSCQLAVLTSWNCSSQASPPLPQSCGVSFSHFSPRLLCKYPNLWSFLLWFSLVSIHSKGINAFRQYLSKADLTMFFPCYPSLLRVILEGTWENILFL